MKTHAIPILALLVLFVATPIIACVTMGWEEGPSAAPMDMAGDCTDDAGPDALPVLCPGGAMIAPTPHVELPGDLVAIGPNPFAHEACRFGSGFPLHCDSVPGPPSGVPLYKFHATYLI